MARLCCLQIQVFAQHLCPRQTHPALRKRWRGDHPEFTKAGGLGGFWRPTSESQTPSRKRLIPEVGALLSPTLSMRKLRLRKGHASQSHQTVAEPGLQCRLVRLEPLPPPPDTAP